MYGLDLFSGIGGLTKALEPWVKPVAYCENDKYAQGVLLSRMSDGRLPQAPIWDDVQTLNASILPRNTDIIYGGFPCQDISCAGRGEGLAGKRSGLFFEIMRLAEEIKPKFIFLENVANIRSKGLNTVIGEMDRLRYDCRWGILSASDVGAPHRRERWWLLAHRNVRCGSAKPGKQQEERAQVVDSSSEGDVADTPGVGMERRSTELKITRQGETIRRIERESEDVPDTLCSGLERDASLRIQETTRGGNQPADQEPPWSSWWTTEPNVGRVAHGIPFRVDRLRGLGNAVVPAQAREAFERLIGFK